MKSTEIRTWLLRIALRRNLNKHLVWYFFWFHVHIWFNLSKAWAFHLIGSHPDVQKKIQSELEDIFGDSDRFVTNDDLGNLKYLECVIKESLRLFPSVPFHGRIITEDTQVGMDKQKHLLFELIWTFLLVDYFYKLDKGLKNDWA